MVSNKTYVGLVRGQRMKLYLASLHVSKKAKIEI